MKLTSFHVALLLCRLTGIGPTLAKRLIDYKGEAEKIFQINPEELLKINGIGQTHLRSISEWKEHKAALIKELNFVQKNRITPFIYGQDSYPLSLKYIDDPPTVFFQKGKVNWANPRIVAIVGTRSPTHHGISFCKMLIEELKAYNPIIVSGFARGIDITAHLEAIKMGMETVAVLGHGLNRFYPENHNKYVEKIQKRGAFITEFWSQDEFKPSNFLKWNRIIAGLAHTTIVIESGSRGGSLVTAKHALVYGRKVFAVLGRVTDQKSQGCLI